jgi:hypothetical protein
MTWKLPEKFEIVRIHWTDTVCQEGWNNYQEVEQFVDAPTDGHMESVGWLIDEDEERIVIAMSHGNYQLGELLKIPRASITEVFKLP